MKIPFFSVLVKFNLKKPPKRGCRELHTVYKVQQKNSKLLTGDPHFKELSEVLFLQNYEMLEAELERLNSPIK